MGELHEVKHVLCFGFFPENWIWWR